MRPQPNGTPPYDHVCGIKQSDETILPVCASSTTVKSLARVVGCWPDMSSWAQTPIRFDDGSYSRMRSLKSTHASKSSGTAKRRRRLSPRSRGVAGTGFVGCGFMSTKNERFRKVTRTIVPLARIHWLHAPAFGGLRIVVLRFVQYLAMKLASTGWPGERVGDGNPRSFDGIRS